MLFPGAADSVHYDNKGELSTLSICVFGGGAVGQYLAGMLHESGQEDNLATRVSVVCRGSTFRDLSQAGKRPMCVPFASYASCMGGPQIVW